MVNRLKMSAKIPKYCLHKHTGQAYILIGSKRHYLGRYNTSDSQKLYVAKIAEWHESVNNRAEVAPSLSVNEFCIIYFRYAKRYYQKDGKPTSQVSIIRSAISGLTGKYASHKADDFSPVKLKEIQSRFIDNGICRTTVNKYIACIQRAFKWGVSEEFISPQVYMALSTVIA